MPDRDQGAQESPRRGRPLDRTFIDMTPPWRAVEASGGETQFDEGHDLAVYFTTVGTGFAKADEAALLNGGSSVSNSSNESRVNSFGRHHLEVALQVKIAGRAQTQPVPEKEANLEKRNSNEQFFGWFSQSKTPDEREVEVEIGNDFAAKLFAMKRDVAEAVLGFAAGLTASFFTPPLAATEMSLASMKAVSARGSRIRPPAISLRAKKMPWSRALMSYFKSALVSQLVIDGRVLCDIEFLPEQVEEGIVFTSQNIGAVEPMRFKD